MTEVGEPQDGWNLPQDTKGGDLEIASSQDFEGLLNLGSSNTCPKHGHNNHADFIDVHNFGLNNLPEEIRHPAMLDYVMAKIPLTVRIVVKWTSTGRPDDDPYAKDRGRRGSRMATGMCNCVAPADSFKRSLCKIPDCHRKSDLGEEHYVYEGDMFIHTNKHVVFDDEEMKKTVVEFFYDCEDKSNVVKEYGLSFRYTKIVSDRIFFVMTVHDETFLNKIISLTKTYTCKAYRIPDQVLQNLNSYIIIISHPHGMPKKISIGRVTKKTLENVSSETTENAKSFGQMYLNWAKHLKAIEQANRQSETFETTEAEVDLKADHQKADEGKHCDGDQLNTTETDSARFPNTSRDQSTVSKCVKKESGNDYIGNYLVYNNKDEENPVSKDQIIKRMAEENEDRGDHTTKRKQCDSACTETTSEPKVIKSCTDEKEFPAIKWEQDTICPNLNERNESQGNHSEFYTAHASQAKSVSGTQDVTVAVDDDENKNEDDNLVEKEEFMSKTSFPIQTVYYDTPTCIGSSGAPVIHGGFHIQGLWVPLTGGHIGYDRDVKCNYFRYNMALA